MLSGISFFEEVIELLYKVFDKTRPVREYGAETTQAACDGTFSLAEGIRNLKLTDLHDRSSKNDLVNTN